jgi:hypothetical protein
MKAKKYVKRMSETIAMSSIEYQQDDVTPDEADAVAFALAAGIELGAMIERGKRAVIGAYDDPGLFATRVYKETLAVLPTFRSVCKVKRMLGGKAGDSDE